MGGEVRQEGGARPKLWSSLLSLEQSTHRSNWPMLPKNMFRHSPPFHVSLLALAYFIFSRFKMCFRDMPLQLRCTILSSLRSRQLLAMTLENISFGSFQISEAITPFFLCTFFKTHTHIKTIPLINL